MKLYVDKEGKILGEVLRSDTKKQLEQFKSETEYLLQSRKREFWDKLHSEIVEQSETEEKRHYLDIETQLKTLPIFIDTWIRTAVESPERWEFFVMAKAQEIGTQDKDKDYYWALAIRHDQLIALTQVITSLVGYLKQWTQLEPKEVMQNDMFWGLAEYPIEKQIYLYAERVHQERLKQFPHFEKH